MPNVQSSNDLIQEDHDLLDFQKRAEAHEEEANKADFVKTFSSKAQLTTKNIPARIRKLPRRYVLHMLILLLLPLGLTFKGDPNATTSKTRTSTSAAQNQPRPALGVSTLTTHRNEPELQAQAATEAPVAQAKIVGDAPISDADFDALVVPVLQPVQAKPSAPSVATASINVEKANLRGGPSTLFDAIDKLEGTTHIELVAVHEDWAEVQTEGGQTGWIALELLDITGDLDTIEEASDVPSLPPAKVALISEDNLNLRDGPGTDYISVGKLAYGTKVDVLTQYNGWLQIQTPNGTIGWSTADFMDMAPGVLEIIDVAETIPEANPALVAWVNTDSVNLREGPSTQYNSLGKMALSTELDLVGTYKDWVKVTTPRGTTGWISSELIDSSSFVLRRIPYTENFPALPKPAPAAPAAPAAPKAAPAAPAAPAPSAGVASGDVASLAWQFVGYPYVWGGETPGVGFDCSGLTKYLYSRIGIYLPHSAAGQYSSQYGSFVGGLNNLQPGDLMFFVNTAGPGITHVGIYVGNGTMINAMTPASGIGAVSIYNSYWLSHYYGAIRPYR